MADHVHMNHAIRGAWNRYRDPIIFTERALTLIAGCGDQTVPCRRPREP